MSAPRGRSKVARLARERLGPLGFLDAGRDGRSHHVFRRPSDGREVRLAASPRDPDVALRNAL